MGNMVRKSGPPKQAQEKSRDKPKKPLPPLARAEDDDCDDGDIATPKRDAYGNDDEPL